MDEQDKKMDVMDPEDEDVVEGTEIMNENEQVVEPRHPEKRAPAAAPRAAAEEDRLAPLFEQADADKFRSHWLEIQSTFVDDPRESVRKADALVDEVIHSMTESFAQRRATIEDQLNTGETASTEDLRMAIKRYRSFFDRLLSLES